MKSSTAHLTVPTCLLCGESIHVQNEPEHKKDTTAVDDHHACPLFRFSSLCASSSYCLSLSYRHSESPSHDNAKRGAEHDDTSEGCKLSRCLNVFDNSTTEEQAQSCQSTAKLPGQPNAALPPPPPTNDTELPVKRCCTNVLSPALRPVLA